MNLRRAVAKYLYATSMVIPCSRSAFNPSVKSEKSMRPTPRFFDAVFTECTWSSYTDCESCSIRPISVLLPSSTLPAVQMRRRPDILPDLLSVRRTGALWPSP